MSICLLLRQSLKSCQSKSFLWREIWSLEILTSHKRLLMMWLCLMTFTQGHLVSSRSLEGKEHNFVLSISFFYWETFEVPTLYKDFLWPEDVNDFNPRPFVQVQGHWKENMHIFCLLYTFLMKHWKILLYIKSAYDLSWGKFKIIFKNLHDSSLGKLNSNGKRLEVKLWSFVQVQGHSNREMLELFYFPSRRYHLRACSQYLLSTLSTLS